MPARQRARMAAGVSAGEDAGAGGSGAAAAAKRAKLVVQPQAKGSVQVPPGCRSPCTHSLTVVSAAGVLPTPVLQQQIVNVAAQRLGDSRTARSCRH